MNDVVTIDGEPFRVTAFIWRRTREGGLRTASYIVEPHTF